LTLPLGIAAFFAMTSLFCILFAFLLLGTVLVGILMAFERTRAIGWIVFCGLWFLVVTTLLWGTRSRAGPASREAMCMSNLKQIALGLHNYHDIYGCLPPAYITDDNGKPMHSWRVLLLPFIENEPLYKQYRFGEPWNGPNNSKLAASYPGIFCYECPSAYGAPNTSYVAVVGPETAWSDAKPRDFKDFADGPDQTILVVEVADSGIHWMEPRDLNFATLPMVVNPPEGFLGISSDHYGANVAFADGSVRFLKEDLPAQTLRALLTIDGGEKVNLDEL
jgi:prepilin-type processing-associated H-X9-DG protein